MYIIKKGGCYVRVVNSIPTVVTTLDKATTFKAGEAEKYIKTKSRSQIGVYIISNPFPFL